MATTLNPKDYFDLPMWRPESPLLAASTAGASLAWDHRNNANGHPYIYYMRSATALDALDPTTGDWLPLTSPALAGSFGAGATAVFFPSQGPRGTLAAGATTSKVILTTALPSAVGPNQLANRGDGVGFRIRIIGNAAGSSGKIEERTIVANTAGTTPTLWLDTPLTFTPATGDGYEIRSGRVFMLSAGVLAAGAYKYYDCATNSYSGTALSITNLPATVGTDSNALALSESHVPYDMTPGEGFIPGGATTSNLLRAIQATAATATTITGSGMFADLAADEYRNFQVRVVEDATTPTAVNQRRRISTHTSGATGVFTVAAWAVTPSATAKFVVENDDDKLLLRSSATTSVYTYNIAANTWDTTTWAAAVAHSTGVVFEQSFGIKRDAGANARHSNIFCIRGGGSSAIDVLDIAGAATGAWSNDIVYGNKSAALFFTTGTTGAYDPATMQGRFLHINVNGTQRFARFDMLNRIIDAGAYLRFPQGTAIVGQKMANGLFIDGATKANFLYHATHTQDKVFSMWVQR